MSIKKEIPIWNNSVYIDRNKLITFSEVANFKFESQHPEKEIVRRKVFYYLNLFFKRISSKTRQDMFTRWFFDQMDYRTDDTLIPTNPNNHEVLLKELTKLRVPKDEKTNICNLISQETTRCAKRLKQFIPKNTGVVKREISLSFVKLSYGVHKILINEKHYHKLCEMHKIINDTNPDSDIFCLVMRYETLSSVGWQGALTEAVFDELLDSFGANMEFFASPLNSRYSTFCSLFPDVDYPFGSFGSCFNFWPEEGSFEANPIFEENIMEYMASHVCILLEKSLKPLSFVIIIPSWYDSVCYEILEKSQYKRVEIVIKKMEHAYILLLKGF